MSRPAQVAHPVSLTHAIGVDAALLAFGLGAVLTTFLIGNGDPQWRNLVFAPAVFVLAAITMRMVVAEIRALWPVLPETDHKGQAIAALMVPIVMAVVVGPMLLIMPFVFFGSI